MEKHTNLRSNLAAITIFLILLFLAIFLYVLLKGIAWNPSSQKESFSDVSVGSTQLVSFQGQRLWTTRLSEQQREKLLTLNAFVHQQKACDIRQQICFVQSKTERQGVIIRYILDKPDSLNREQKWFGGFINPANGAAYDLLGRAYLSNPDGQSQSIYYQIK